MFLAAIWRLKLLLWTNLLVNIALVVLIEILRQSRGTLPPSALLILGVSVAWSTYRGSLRMGLASATINCLYTAYVSFISTLDPGNIKALQIILPSVGFFAIVAMLGQQKNHNRQLSKELYQIRSHWEVGVRERTNMLSVANEFLQQEIGDRLGAQEALYTNESRLKLIIDTMPLLISYVDSRQRYCFGNQQYEALILRSSTNLEGKHIREVIGKSHYEQIKSCIEAALAGKEVSSEHTFTIHNGEKRNLRLSFIPHFDNEKKVIGLLTLGQDLTNYRWIERN